LRPPFFFALYVNIVLETRGMLLLCLVQKKKNVNLMFLSKIDQLVYNKHILQLLQLIRNNFVCFV